MAIRFFYRGQKRVDFLKDLQSEVEEDNVAATLVANRGDGTNAIVFP